MKRSGFIIIICLLIMPLSVSVMPQEEKAKMAVSEFNTLSDEADSSNLGASSSDIIEKSLIDIDRFAIRKKGEIQSYINDMEKVQLGIEDVNALEDMSKKLKVDYLIVGSVYKVGNNCEMDARAVNMKTWMIAHSSGINAFDPESAASYIGKDIYYTFTKENLEQKEKESRDNPKMEVFRFRDETDSSISFGYGESFAEMLNSEMGALRGISVRERINSKSLFAEKALEMAGITENDNSFEMFLENNVGYLLRGDIRVLSDLICVNCQAINTSSKKVVFLEHVEISSPKTFRPLARRMAKKLEDSLNNKIGTLNITTRPGGASILIDDEYAGNAPVIISVEKGKHVVRARHDGYETAVSEIEILPKRINSLSFSLQAVSTKLLSTAQQFERKKDYNSALECYREFIQKYGDTKEADIAYYRMGHVLLIDLKKYDEALTAFQSLVNRYPDANTRAEAYYGMANTYTAMGDKQKAGDIIDYILIRYPETFTAETIKSAGAENVDDNINQ